MTGALIALAAGTARLSWRVGGGAVAGLIFFLSVTVVVPFAIGPDLPLIAKIGPAVLWIGALLSTLIGLDRLFQDDRDDGSLDLLVLSGQPLELLFLAKAIGHWLATGLPLAVAAPVLGLLLNIEPAALGAVALTLLFGTPTLALIGAIGAALLVALRRGGMMIAVLVLPMTIPVLIFGIAATDALAKPDPSFPPLLVEIALFLIALVVAPVAGAAALRVGVGE